MNWWQKLFSGARSKKAEIIRTSDSTESGSFPESGPIHLEITDVLDLHPFAPRDVEGIVEEYLHLAFGKGIQTVRIIHGKGIGVQREMVRNILARTRFVQSFQDAPGEAGGWGATVAWFISPSDARNSEKA